MNLTKTMKYFLLSAALTGIIPAQGMWSSITNTLHDAYENIADELENPIYSWVLGGAGVGTLGSLYSGSIYTFAKKNPLLALGTIPLGVALYKGYKDQRALNTGLDRALSNHTSPHQLEEIEEWLKKGADPNYTLGYFTQGALYWIIARTIDSEERRNKIIDLLLTYGADINGINKYFSPLHSAVHCRKFELAKRLMDLGAKPNKYSCENLNTFLVSVVRSGNIPFLKLCLKNMI